MTIGSIETCSVWKNNNNYTLWHTEYVVLFMCLVYIEDTEPTVTCLHRNIVSTEASSYQKTSLGPK
jgi:hypothetical protein